MVGLNSNLTDRLRQVRVGAHNLSDALRAQRVRADGTVTDLKGLVTPADVWSDGLLYLNTSLGWPCLENVRPGIVVIDRASFRNPDTIDRALAWCTAHRAERILVLGTLGEPLPKGCIDDRRWLRWGWTPGLRCDIQHELGRAPNCGPLSTNPLINLTPHPIGVAEYQAPELTRLRRVILQGIAAARRTNQPFPKIIADTVQLVNILDGLWGSVQTANEYLVNDPRGVSTATLRRSVQQLGEAELSGPWAAFRETQWPELRRHTLARFDLLEAHNPHFDLLQGMLDWATANRPGARIVVRTRSRSGAAALQYELASTSADLKDRLGDGNRGSNLVIAPYADRLPWATVSTVELHLGVPAPWRRGALMSAEANEHILAVDRDERRWLITTLAKLNSGWVTVLGDAADQLCLSQLPTSHLALAGTVFGPLRIDTRGDTLPDAEIAIPSIDLSRIFDEFSDAVTKVAASDGDDDRGSTVSVGGRLASSRPVILEPGDTMCWLPSDGHVEVLVGAHYSSTPVSALTVGQSLVIPRGETREELYSRLLQAAHQDSDVLAVTTLLQRFRSAMRRLHNKHGSWEMVARELRGRGSCVRTGQTCQNWATGAVIAPDDTLDIRRVGWLAQDDGLLLNHAWERIGAIASELRTLHRGLGRVLSAAIGESAAGHRGENLRRLSELCGGIDPTEILEEFEIRQIRALGTATTVPSSQLRRIVPFAVATKRPA